MKESKEIRGKELKRKTRRRRRKRMRSNKTKHQYYTLPCEFPYINIYKI